MADLIDRQAAIDAVRSYMADSAIEDGDWHADGIAYDIRRLPSAQPTQTNTPNALQSLDCISRQAAIDVLNKHSVMFGFHLPHEFHEVKEEIRGLPSAQPEHATCYLDGPCEYQNPGIKIPMPTAEPKTGRWEKMGARGRVYRCNQCGNFLDFDGVNVGRGDANFCPNCGAKMEGDTDATD